MWVGRTLKHRGEQADDVIQASGDIFETNIILKCILKGDSTLRSKHLNMNLLFHFCFYIQSHNFRIVQHFQTKK